MLNTAYGDAAINRTACFQGGHGFFNSGQLRFEDVERLGHPHGPLAAHTLTNLTRWYGKIGV